MKILSFLFLAFLMACNNQKDEKNDGKISVTQIFGKKFFIYDSIIHYQTDFHDSSLVELSAKQSTSVFDSLKNGVLLKQIPNNVNDTFFISHLEIMDFIRRHIDKSSFKIIDSIFVEKSYSDSIIFACPQIYRDVLVFKEHNKITGIAKICLSCRHHKIIGTDANTDNFGTASDYDKLNSLLVNNGQR